MDKLTEGVITILTLLVGVAILALIISPKAKTSEVIQAAASGFGNDLAVAESPVTGEHVKIDTSYPSSGMGFGMPQMSAGGLPGLY